MVRSSDPDNPVWEIEVERPMEPGALTALAELLGFPVPGDNQMSDIDMGSLRPHLIRVAASVLTDHQLHLWQQYYLYGRTQQEIAEELGITKSAVQQALHGTARRAGYWRTDPAAATAAGTVRVGGAMRKVRDAATSDPMIQAILADHASAQVESLPPPALTWWAPCRSPSRAHLCAPLLVLYVLDHICDAKRTARIDELFRYLPQSVVNGCITKMRQMLWIDTDGVVATVKMTPIEQDDERRIV